MKKLLPLIICAFAAIQLSGQAYPDRHSTSFTDAWVSCEASESPNIKRDPGHWIMYDFGTQYSLHESKIWNFNVPDTTVRGARDIVVDYSNDGETWIELGDFTLLEAPGSAFYQGDEGPDFDGVVARFVLISILNTHGDPNCAGISEVKINATVATSTNVPDGVLDLDLTANPNPASDYTTISLGSITSDMKYSLADMTGKLLRQGQVLEAQFRLNTANLASGTYSLSIANGVGQKSMLLTVINN